MPKKSYSETIKATLAATSDKGASGFSWADDVEDTLYADANVSSERALSVAYATGAHFQVIEGIKYKQPAGTQPAIFNPDDPDKRYQYDNEPNMTSPTSDTMMDEFEHYEPPPVVHTPKPPRKKSKNRRRKADPLRGPQTTPPNTHSDVFTEKEAAKDDFMSNLPQASQLLVPVNPKLTPIVENLWADFED